jgi:hypothetical protein
MKKDNIVQIKSYEFALLCIKLFQNLSKNKKEYILSKQILRSKRNALLVAIIKRQYLYF